MEMREKMNVIPLTDCPPVRIKEDEWPILAHGDYRNFICNQLWCVHIYVRQHNDGRCIVYGTYDFDSLYEDKPNIEVYAGVFLNHSENDMIVGIHDVGEILRNAVDCDSAIHISSAVRKCIADLPAEDL